MLEGLATWFLNNYLENLDTDHLYIFLLQGEVELEIVPLRKDALRFIELSIEVNTGVVCWAHQAHHPCLQDEFRAVDLAQHCAEATVVQPV